MQPGKLASKINAREYWFLEQKPPQYCHLKRHFMSRNNHLQALREMSRFHRDVTETRHFSERKVLSH